MTKRFASIAIQLVLLLTVVGGGLWLILNRQVVYDWWRLQSYTPTTEVKQLANADTMVGRGRELFYVSNPVVQDSATFNKSCTNEGEKTIILGCYKLQSIFLFNVTDERLAGVKEVTAAHEMLHAAYERLDSSEKKRVNALLKPVIDGMSDKRILELISLYNQQEPGELYNEMHSILGTEYASLPADLEEYYRQYFSDRQKVVSYAVQYQGVFTESEAKLEAFDQQLTALKPQIDQNNATLQQQQAELQALGAQLEQLRAAGRYQEYNQGVSGYNAKVTQFNALVEQTRAMVARYNNIVTERNQQATAQNNLYQSLNSNYQPAAQQ